MALIDTLPKFRHKPLGLEPAPTRLVEKPPERVPVTTNIVAPTVAPATPTQVAASTATLAPAPVKPRVAALPASYSMLTPLYEAVADSTVVNPKARAALIAQVGLEKGWNWDPNKDHNYGNITAGSTWKGQTVDRPDTDAQGRPITQKFRKYNSPKEYLDDYLALLKNQYPAAYSALHSPDFNIDQFTQGLVGGKFRYAENPNYSEEIKRVYTGVDAKINKTNQ